ncbi:hypothetical protein ACU4IU_09545 [Brevibacterium sp. CSND-B09]|uniref:hypothetical protein n=1 Tax=Brevibacterium sp. CSND-B09 TaxID=3462571 RepID=UPI00406A16D3
MSTIAKVEEEDRVGIEIVAEHSWDQNPYSEDGVELARTVADDLGLTSAKVMTVAVHDSTNMKDEDLVSGLHHLTEVVRRLAAGALA